MSELFEIAAQLSKPFLEAFDRDIRQAYGFGDTSAVQDAVNKLNEAIMASDPSNECYGRGIQYIRRWCRTSGHLPSAFILIDPVDHASLKRRSQTALSDVYMGSSGGTAIAVKAVRLLEENRAQIKGSRSFLCEAVVWRYLRHPNIVPFLGVMTSKEHPFCLVSEWMEEGTLLMYLRIHTRENRRVYIEHIILGLTFMHSLGVVHGDLKGANILVDANRIARLADFGLATILYDTPSAMTCLTGSIQGTVRWMAPELLNISADGSETPRPSVPSDIYALSITLWEVFTCQIPFSHIRPDALVVMGVLSGQRPSRPNGLDDIGLSDEIWNLMEHGWHHAPARRPSLGEFLLKTPKTREETTSDYQEDVEILFPEAGSAKAISHSKGATNEGRHSTPSMSNIVLPSSGSVEANHYVAGCVRPDDEAPVNHGSGNPTFSWISQSQASVIAAAAFQSPNEPISSFEFRLDPDAVPSAFLVAEGIYLGNLEIARSARFLRDCRITYVLSVCTDEVIAQWPQTGLQHLRVPVEDTEYISDLDACLLVWLRVAVLFIASARAQGGIVLVHSVRGQSRAAAVISAYLMYSRGLSATAAMAHVRAACEHIRIPGGFLEQLVLFGLCDYDPRPGHGVFRSWRAQVARALLARDAPSSAGSVPSSVATASTQSSGMSSSFGA